MKQSTLYEKCIDHILLNLLPQIIDYFEEIEKNEEIEKINKLINNILSVV